MGEIDEARLAHVLPYNYAAMPAATKGLQEPSES